MKGKLRTFSLLGIAAVLLCLYVLRVVQLNLAWPAPPLEVYALGETVEGPYTTEYVVHSARFMSQEEAEQYYVERNDWEHLYLVVDVSITNTGEQELKEYMNFTQPRSNGWTNGFCPHLFQGMYDQEGAYPVLGPGETVRREFAFDLSDGMFKDSQWPHVTERPYQLVITSYPVLRVVELFPENS